MKKALSILLAILLVMGIVMMPVLADDSNFVPSIEEKDEPVLDDDPDLPEGLELVVTPYSQKNSPAYGLDCITDNLDNAYDSISDADSVADLCPALKSQAQADDVDPDDLVVSQLFDATVVDTATETAMDPYNEPVTFTLKDNLNRFDNWYVLVNPDGNGWELIPKDRLSYDPATRKLTVNADKLCAFAIVVEDKEGPVSPQTSDNRAYFLLAAVLLVSLAAVTVKKAVKNN